MSKLLSALLSLFVCSLASAEESAPPQSASQTHQSQSQSQGTQSVAGQGDTLMMNGLPEGFNPVEILEQIDNVGEFIGILNDMVKAEPGKDFVVEDGKDTEIRSSFVCKAAYKFSHLTPEEKKAAADNEALSQVIDTFQAFEENKLYRAMFFGPDGECGHGLLNKISIKKCGKRKLIDIDMDNKYSDSRGLSRIDFGAGEIYVEKLDKMDFAAYKKPHMVVSGKTLRFEVQQSEQPAQSDVVRKQAADMISSYKASEDFDKAVQRGRPGESFSYYDITCALEPNLCDPNSYGMGRDIYTEFDRISNHKHSVGSAESEMKRACDRSPSSEYHQAQQEMQHEQDKLERMYEKEHSESESKREEFERQAYKVQKRLAQVNGLVTKCERLTNALKALADEKNNVKTLSESDGEGKNPFATKADFGRVVMPPRLGKGCSAAKDGDESNGRMGIGLLFFGGGYIHDEYFKEMLMGSTKESSLLFTRIGP